MKTYESLFFEADGGMPPCINIAGHSLVYCGVDDPRPNHYGEILPLQPYCEHCGEQPND